MELAKKATINPKNTKDNKCFQYALTVALNHREIGKDPQRISKIKPYIDKYNWKDIYFRAGIKDLEKFERNNTNIALNILYVPTNAIVHLKTIKGYVINMIIANQ